MVADKQGSVVKCINDGQSGAKARHSRCECLCAVQKKKIYWNYRSLLYCKTWCLWNELSSKILSLMYINHTVLPGSHAFILLNSSFIFVFVIVFVFVSKFCTRRARCKGGVSMEHWNRSNSPRQRLVPHRKVRNPRGSAQYLDICKNKTSTWTCGKTTLRIVDAHTMEGKTM